MQLDPTSEEAFRVFLNGLPEDDKDLIPRFFIDKKLMGAKSEAAGRPVYEDREYIEVKIKGQDKQIVVSEVTQKDKERFPRAYAAFQHSKPLPVIGTPVEMMPGVGPSMAHDLKGLSLRTVEDLARVTDENTLSRIGMGARDLVNRAKAWLAQQAPAVGAAQAQVEELQKQLAESEAKAAAEREAFEKRLAALEKPAKKGRRSAADTARAPA